MFKLIFEILTDPLGFTINALLEYLILAIINAFGGGPVGIDTLAATIGEEATTIEDVYEPYLLQLGFLNRTPRGRMVTKLAYEHFGIDYLKEDQISF